MRLLWFLGLSVKELMEPLMLPHIFLFSYPYKCQD